MKIALLLAIVASIAACGEQSGSSTKNASADTTASKSTAVNEQIFIPLGGEEQYVEITGASSELPVLLFIHGGPGWPQTPLLRYFNADLSKHMVLVAWEQSGCGKSWMKNPDAKNISLEQLVSDAHELTQVLKKKFNQDKIYIAGFSWGSVIGLKLVEKYPDDYKAYFGISQLVNINESVKVSRKWIRDQAKANNDQLSLRTLDSIDKRRACKTDMECFFKQHGVLKKYRGDIHTKEAEQEIEKAMVHYADYKDYDWMGGFFNSVKYLEKDLFAYDLSSINDVKIPMYFLAGRHDWNIPASVTENYYNNLKAPKKEMIWFENSGHEPLEEEAAKFNQVMIERVK